MKLRLLAAIGAALFLAALSRGQSATLTVDTPVAPAGAVLTLTASTHYAGTPSAMGWAVTLPEGWSFVATSGPSVPQVGPQGGATGTLEWAYANVPANAASFRFTVKTAGRPGQVQLPARVFLRVDGRQQTVEVAPVNVTVGP